MSVLNKQYPGGLGELKMLKAGKTRPTDTAYSPGKIGLLERKERTIII